jgi:hypothetical protein
MENETMPLFFFNTNAIELILAPHTLGEALFAPFATVGSHPNSHFEHIPGSNFDDHIHFEPQVRDS